MAEPFKNWFDDEAVQWIAGLVSAVHPDFDSVAFADVASTGLDRLELKARVAQISAALGGHLPPAWPEALGVMMAALPEALPDASEVSSNVRLWPLLHLVETQGLDHPEASLDALPELTKRFTAEFAIRPFLLAHPEAVWPRVLRWTADPDPHVRRLCSEGTRPRLPWGIRLTDAVANPTRGLQVLDRLVDDPELYVRRSVANHLNDVSKDHPQRAVATARQWLAQPSAERRWVVKHALRSLVKAGDADALDVLGFGPPEATVRSIGVAPDPGRIGEAVQLSAQVVAGASQRWLVDWVVGSPKANGELSRRVVKGSQCQVTAGEVVELSQHLSLKPVTTRVTRPGRWRVGIQVNGQLLGEVTFEVGGL